MEASLAGTNSIRWNGMALLPLRMTSTPSTDGTRASTLSQQSVNSVAGVCEGRRATRSRLELSARDLRWITVDRA